MGPNCGDARDIELLADRRHADMSGLNSGPFRLSRNLSGGDNENDPGYPGSLRTWCSSLSTSVFRGVGDNVKLLGEIIPAFSPPYRSSPQMEEWTRRDSNPHPRSDRELCCRCTTDPIGSFASCGDRCKDASHNSFGRFQIGKAGQHAENDVNVPSVLAFPLSPGFGTA